METSKLIPKQGIIDSYVTPNTIEIAQTWPKDFVDYFVRIGRKEVVKGLPLKGMISEMNRVGIEKVLLNAMDTRDFKISSDTVGEIILEYPSRFIGCAMIEPTRKFEGVKELQRLTKKYGFKVFKLIPSYLNLPPNDKIYYPYYAKCCELGLTVQVQVGRTNLPFLNEPGRPSYLEEVILYFPELKVIGSHIGYPWTGEMIALAEKYENVYIDTACYNPSEFEDSFIKFLKGKGNKKVLFASDWPVADFQLYLKEFLDLPLTEEAISNLLRNNALRAFNLQ
jgi:uncharacterized protein